MSGKATEEGNKKGDDSSLSAKSSEGMLTKAAKPEAKELP